jgi:hypothetical protein
MSNPETQPRGTEGDDDEGEGSPLVTLLIGVGVCAFAAYLAYYFTQLEAGEASGRRMWWPIALLYNLGGKWPPVGLVGLAGLAGVGLGVKGLLAPKKPS